MFKFGAISGRGFFSALLALAGSVRGLSHMIGPSAPVYHSSFRKRGRSHKKMMKHPPNRTGWFQRHATIAPFPITERTLMRHGWYRRKLRKEGIAVDPGAKNSMVLR